MYVFKNMHRSDYSAWHRLSSSNSPEQHSSPTLFFLLIHRKTEMQWKGKSSDARALGYTRTSTERCRQFHESVDVKKADMPNHARDVLGTSLPRIVTVLYFGGKSVRVNLVTTECKPSLIVFLLFCIIICDILRDSSERDIKQRSKNPVRQQREDHA